MNELRLAPIAVLIALLALSTPAIAAGSEQQPELTFSIEEKITLSPTAEEMVSSETLLTMGGSISGIDFASQTELGGDDISGLSRQEMELTYDFDSSSTSLKAVFDPSRNGLDYFLQRGQLEGDDVDLSNLLLLEYMSEENTYGAGFEVGFSGRTERGVGLSAKIRFGMDEYLREVYDPAVRGSGYYIITDQGAGPSAFPFGSALVEISDLSLGPCTVANRTKFMRDEGLLFTGFSFDLINKPPWKTRGYVYFSEEDETVTLVPTLQFGEGVWNVVADFGGKLEGEDWGLEKLEIRGVKLNDIDFGGLKLSATSSLAGSMKKEKGAKMLELRAEDYKLSRSFDEIARDYLFEKVDWSDVVTLEYDRMDGEKQGRYMAIDWYFKKGEAGSLFDVKTINGVARWEPERDLTFGTSISLETEAGLGKIVFEAEHQF